MAGYDEFSITSHELDTLTNKYIHWQMATDELTRKLFQTDHIAMIERISRIHISNW